MRRLPWPLLIFAPLLAQAGDGLLISPVSTRLAASDTQAVVRVSNPGNRPWAAEAHLYAWRQQDDEDQLVPAQDLALSPAHFEIAAGGEQRLRLVRLAEPPAQAERSYRLVIEQRRDPAAPGQPLLRYSAPVFVAPQAALPTRPVLVVERVDAGDGAQLRLRNPGPRHARLADLAYVSADGRRLSLYPGLAGYVLPGQGRAWTLPAAAGGYADGHFLARIDDQPEAALPWADAPAP